MREIKFRIWRPSNTWCPPGDLYLRADGKLCLDISGHREGYAPDEKNIIEMPNTSSFRICQFTDLRDKNGKEIYEGDIVRSKKGEMAVVAWEEAIDRDRYWATAAGFGVIFDKDWAEGRDNDGRCPFEVVGNIYENADLIPGDMRRK